MEPKNLPPENLTTYEPVKKYHFVVANASGKCYIVYTKFGVAFFGFRFFNTFSTKRIKSMDTDKTPFKFGVMTHCATHWDSDILKIFAEAGIRHFRDEMQWAAFEAERGVFKIPERCAVYLAEAERLGMTQLLPLTFGNPQFYDPIEGVAHWAAAPYTDEGFDAYARYCAEAVKVLGERVKAVEIWNEYNGGFARGPADGKPEVYAEMLKRASRAIRAVRPDVRIYAGDTIGIPLEWLDTVLLLAGPDSYDGVSVHPYGYLLTPEWNAKNMEKLRALIRKHNGGKDKPICVSEQGWYTTAAGEQGRRAAIDEATQAKYLVRAWTLFAAHGVEEAYWYLGRDDEMFGTMGLLRKDYSPKPAFHAYAEMVRMLEGRRFVRRTDLGDEDLHCYEFEGGLCVRWCCGKFDRVKLADGTELSTVPAYGNLADAAAAGGVKPEEMRYIDLPEGASNLTPLGMMDGEYVRLFGDRNGDDDLSGEAWLGWDSATLRFRAVVRDDVHYNSHHGGMGWKGDNVQLGFSAAMPWAGGEWTEPWHEYGMQLGARGAEISGVQGAKVSIVRDESAKTTTYVAALPWAEISPSGKPCDFSFALFVNDNDGAGRKGYWKWGDIKCLDKMRAFKLRRAE